MVNSWTSITFYNHIDFKSILTRGPFHRLRNFWTWKSGHSLILSDNVIFCWQFYVLPGIQINGWSEYHCGDLRYLHSKRVILMQTCACEIQFSDQGLSGISNLNAITMVEIFNIYWNNQMCLNNKCKSAFHSIKIANSSFHTNYLNWFLKNEKKKTLIKLSLLALCFKIGY